MKKSTIDGPDFKAVELMYILIALFAIALFSMSTSVSWATDLTIPIETGTPNFIGLGVGGYPDYLGSDDYSLGVAPVVRIGLGGERYAILFANDLEVNLLNHPNWRAGPELLYRFGRKDIDDPVVSQMDEIDNSVDLGLFGGYTWIDPREPLKRVGFKLWGLWDASGVDSGAKAGVRMFGMVPVARPLTLIAGSAATWGSGNYMNTYFGVSPSDSQKSGLPVFTADSGLRDTRGWLVAMFHLNRNWHLGAGLMYSRLLGDAAGSPVVSERGSENQWVYGAGLVYGW